MMNESVKLHLYGKKQARVGRKMGHMNCLGKTPSDALRISESVAKTLRLTEAVG